MNYRFDITIDLDEIQQAIYTEGQWHPAANATAWGVMIFYIALGMCFWGYAKIMQRKSASGWEQVIQSPVSE